MSEEQTTDKDQNFENLRKKAEALEAQVAALAPLKVAQTVREAGFDPDTPAGKALSRLADADSDADTVKNLAAELGFEVEEPPSQLTKEERAAQEFANRRNDLQSVTVSDEPESIDDKIKDAEAALAAARAAKNWDQARSIGATLTRLNSEKIFAQTMAAGR